MWGASVGAGAPYCRLIAEPANEGKSPVEMPNVKHEVVLPNGGRVTMLAYERMPMEEAVRIIRYAIQTGQLKLPKSRRQSVTFQWLGGSSLEAGPVRR